MMYKAFHDLDNLHPYQYPSLSLLIMHLTLYTQATHYLLWLKVCFLPLYNNLVAVLSGDTYVLLTLRITHT